MFGYLLQISKLFRFCSEFLNLQIDSICNRYQTMKTTLTQISTHPVFFGGVTRLELSGWNRKEKKKKNLSGTKTSMLRQQYILTVA